MLKIRSLALTLALFAQTGCLYLDTTVPLDTDVNVTKLGAKKGVSSVQSIAWLVAWGDGGTEAAAKNGDLAVINHLDTRIFMVLFGLYTRMDTIAYGD
jgi:hypothetical protein